AALPHVAAVGAVIGSEKAPDVVVVVIGAQIRVLEGARHLGLEPRPTFSIGRRVVSQSRHQVDVMLDHHRDNITRLRIGPTRVAASSGDLWCLRDASSDAIPVGLAPPRMPTKWPMPTS